jgi:RHS repeat-associated protein
MHPFASPRLASPRLASPRLASPRLPCAALLALALCWPLTADAAVTVSPSPSYTGSYTVTWTDTSGGNIRAYLAQRVNAGSWTKTTVTGTTSRAYTAMAVADYAYKVQIYSYDSELRKEIFEYETAAVTVQVWKSIPAAPGPITGPTVAESGTPYTLTWTAPAGVVTRYELLENGVKLPDLTTTSITRTSLAAGSYANQVRACNGLGCGPYTSVFTVTVPATLTTQVADGAFGAAEQSLATPMAQGWTGRLAGKAAADGGAASYRIDVEVPPGRLGMQPAVALTYASRNGNGVAGVGWQLAAGGSVYRCPRLLDPDGASRPVQLDLQDKLCFEGQRLVVVAGTYGYQGSEYRTEIDSFARITLQGGDMNAPGSWFKVERKSGRIARYEAARKAFYDPRPATWLLAHERDQQGNCVAYAYAAFATAAGGLDQETVLSSIVYTGTGTDAGCQVDSSVSSVAFAYSAGREDRRTTYQAGAATMSTARLDSITTYALGVPVLRYGLAYKTSAATRRSLLASVQKCAGSGCQNGSLGPTTFSYQEDMPLLGAGVHQRFDDPTAQGVKAGQDWRVWQADDFDGDGKRDVFMERVYPAVQHLTLSRLGSMPVDPTWGAGFDTTTVLSASAADVDEDGLADVVGNSGGKLAFASYANYANGSTPTFIIALDELGHDFTVEPGTLLSTPDYDGDGLVDLVVAKGTTCVADSRFGDLEVKLHRRLPNPGCTGACRPVFSSVGIAIPLRDGTCPGAQNIEMETDLNGDGQADQFRAFDGTPGLSATTGIAYSTGVSPTSTYSMASLAWRPGGTPTSVSGTRYWMDVNGDGLQDIYFVDSGVLWLNRGGAPGAHKFLEVDVSAVVDSDLVTPLTIDTMHQVAAFTMDADGDGATEVMVPAARSGAEHCRYKQTLGGEYDWFCGDDPGPAPVQGDKSFYSWDAYKLRDRGDGTYWLVRVRTGLVAPVGVSKAPGDFDGDGMTDVAFRIAKETQILQNGMTQTFAYYTGLPDSAMGPYFASGRSRAPDLMTSATDGLGAVARWSYQPLSFNPETPTRPGPSCAVHAAGAEFYKAANQGARGSGYVFFTSSMWAVSELDVSHGVEGVSTTTAATCYRYEDAMLHLRGRGFQGFKKIIAEQRLPQADGESTAAGDTCGVGPCSLNNLRTTTEFNQEFPFTDTPKKVRVERVSGPRLLSEEKTWWHAEQLANGVKVVYPTSRTQSKFDLADPNSPAEADILAVTTTITEVETSSGETTKSCTVHEDKVLARLKTQWASVGGLPADGSPTPLSIAQETRALQSEPAVWWLGKLASSTSSTDAYTGGQPALAAATTGRAALTKSPTTPAVCPVSASTPLAKARYSEFTWKPATAAAGSRRMPATKAIRPLGATETEQEATFTSYDQYGNLLAQSVTARGVVDASNARLAQVTTFTPGADGYFVEAIQNAAGHVGTTLRDRATGQVTYQQEVQGGPGAWATYDTLGRPLTTTKQGAQPVNHREVGCAPLGAATCAPGEVLLRQTTQVGAPTTLQYLDRLGRVVRTATTALDGRQVVSEAQYNERGLKVAEFAPRFEGAAGCEVTPDGDPTCSTRWAGFDHLGRPTLKTAKRAAAIFAGGSDPAPLVTRYTHSGGRTDIVADEGGPRPLRMTRTYDTQGRLAETTQHELADGSPYARARYLYDPSGVLTHILDSGNNDLSAEYDALGRKRKVKDPDRGTWLYDWDGLGRLQFQTDARGRVTEQEYDLIGRPTLRTVSLSTGYSWAAWTYDTAGLGLLAKEEDSNEYLRTFSYDGLRRPARVTTAIPASDSKQTSGVRTFTLEYGYDRNYGRLKAIRYPSNVNALGELVALKYDGRGHLLGEVGLNADYSEGKRYRLVRAMSERGQVTEQRLGNCVRETGEYDPSTGLALTLTAGRPSPAPGSLPADLAQCPAADGVTGGVSLVRQGVYRYDRFLNLATQSKNVSGLQAEERFTYDELQRLTSAGRCTGAGCVPSAAQTDTYVYDNLGNLTQKSDWATGYRYGNAARSAGGQAGPHAVWEVTKVGGAVVPYLYDLNGNLESGDGRTIGYDELDRPVTIVSGGTTSEFKYGPSGARYRQEITGTPGAGFGPKTVYYVDKEYELTVWDPGSSASGTMEERTFVGSSVVVLTSQSPTNVKTRTVRYQHADRLGSVEAVTEDTVAALELTAGAHSFDPWGKPRNATFGSSSDRLHPGGEPGTESTRGFTGHEQLDAHYLTHMNGRVYDYRLGRFLSVDPIISNPANPQSINPYSYIGNNPLSGTDPTGYDACPAGSAEQCSNAKSPGSLADARRMGSIAGRGGDNVRVNGVDQDVSSMAASNVAAGQKNAGSTSNGGGSNQGSRTNNTNPNTEGGPGQTATTPPGDAESRGKADGTDAAGPRAPGTKPRPANQPVDPVPTDDRGRPTPPPVPVPGCAECTWTWSPDSRNPRGGRWIPEGFPPTPGGYPGASWDTGSRGGPGHWDVDHGDGETRTRYFPDGRPMPDAVVHPPGWRPQWREVLGAGAAAGGGYLLYRGIRMAPSVLVPPLWPTIPANAAIP